ncbi:hypothetical protein TNCT_61741 [Trichonephila clavata]|uniref:Uncharacterized protein n=1 Tax=Trichonephila clavata TaxID=2740835 RepID=A0A8X6IM61_TRICU|nr:hypothetical protein TNCT_61741 [Trichonephila clavata]
MKEYVAFKRPLHPCIALTCVNQYQTTFAFPPPTLLLVLHSILIPTHSNMQAHTNRLLISQGASPPHPGWSGSLVTHPKLFTFPFVLDGKGASNIEERVCPALFFFSCRIVRKSGKMRLMAPRKKDLLLWD